jgi:hypothetical protein
MDKDFAEAMSIPVLEIRGKAKVKGKLAESLGGARVMGEPLYLVPEPHCCI